MIDRQHGNIVVECDACSEVLETETRDFDEARAVMKREGWSAREFGGVWQHGCDRCGPPKVR